MELNAKLPMAPSGWRVREALSYDLPYLWPAEYEADGPPLRAGRRRPSAPRSCGAAGVRRCVLPVTEPAAVPRRRGGARLEHARVRVRPGRDARVRRVGGGDLARSGGSRLAARGALRPGAARRCRAAGGDAGHVRRPRDARAVRRAHRRGRRHARRGRGLGASAPACWSCAIRTIPRGRPRWTACPSPIVRANGLYRAVALPPGRHVIRFSYRPRDLVAGLIISGMTVCPSRAVVGGVAPVRPQARSGRRRLHADRADGRAGDHRRPAGDRLQRVPRHAGAGERRVGAGVDALDRGGPVAVRADLRQHEIREHAAGAGQAGAVDRRGLPQPGSHRGRRVREVRLHVPDGRQAARQRRAGVQRRPSRPTATWPPPIRSAPA